MALGLTGRYLGGQATQQEQRFDALDEDPDQFAGWFYQAMKLFTLQLPFVGSQRVGFMSGNHRGGRSLVGNNTFESEGCLSGDLFDQN
jgi:hypothetical protein